MTQTAPSEPVHRATVVPAGAPYVARIGDVTVARSERALILQEVNAGKSYAPVVYFPRNDVAPGLLAPSDHKTHCPIKGDAGYFSLKLGDRLLENAAWFYPEPVAMVAAVKDHVAFYPDKVTVERA